MTRLATLALCASMAAIAPAHAQLLGLGELRGGVGLEGVGSSDPQIGAINAELLIAVPLADAIIPFGQLRPHAGASLALPERSALLYTGLTYAVPIGPLFVEAGLGAALDAGAIGAEIDRCALLARPTGGVGVRVTPSLNLMASIDHVTDFGACDTGTSRSSVGVRAGIAF